MGFKIRESRETEFIDTLDLILIFMAIENLDTIVKEQQKIKLFGFCFAVESIGHPATWK